MTPTEFEKRLALLEAQAAGREPIQEAEPFYSEAHGCMMVDRCGFIFPVILPPAEWEAVARVQQAALVGSYNEP